VEHSVVDLDGQDAWVSLAVGGLVVSKDVEVFAEFD